MSQAIQSQKSTSRKSDLREDTVVTVYAKALQLWDEQRTLVIGAAVGLVALIAIGIGVSLMQGAQEDEAQAMLGAVLPAYESGSYEQALEGADGASGLLFVADEYSGTDAGNLAAFYAGDVLFRLGRYEEAIDMFDSFDGGSTIVGASAIAGQAQSHAALGNHEQAGNLFRQAALLIDDEVTAPQHFLNAGEAYEEAGAFAQAVDVYEELLAMYPDAQQSTIAEIGRARATAQL